MALPAPWKHAPLAIDGIHLMGWLQAPLAAELKTVQHLVRSTPQLFSSLSDLSFPEVMSLPESFRHLDPERAQLAWSSPYVLVSDGSRIAWCGMESRAEWKVTEGELVGAFSDHAALFFDKKNSLVYWDLDKTKPLWSVTVPVAQVGSLKMGLRKGPLVEIIIRPRVEGVAQTRSHWLNIKLAAWVYESSTEAGEIADTVQNTTAGQRCPHRDVRLPRYDLEGARNALCFNSETQQWTTKSHPSKKMTDVELVRFWKKWFETIAQPAALSLRLSEEGRVQVSGLVRDQRTIDRTEWYLERLCVFERDCGVDLSFGLLPKKQSTAVSKAAREID